MLFFFLLTEAYKELLRGRIRVFATNSISEMYKIAHIVIIITCHEDITLRIKGSISFENIHFYYR